MFRTAPNLHSGQICMLVADAWACATCGQGTDSHIAHSYLREHLYIASSYLWPITWQALSHCDWTSLGILVLLQANQS